jgi:hypothetical protein
MENHFEIQNKHKVHWRIRQEGFKMTWRQKEIPKVMPELDRTDETNRGSKFNCPNWSRGRPWNRSETSDRVEMGATHADLGVRVRPRPSTRNKSDWREQKGATPEPPTESWTKDRRRPFPSSSVLRRRGRSRVAHGRTRKALRSEAIQTGGRRFQFKSPSQKEIYWR